MKDHEAKDGPAGDSGDCRIPMLQMVPFYGDQIVTFDDDGRPHVAMRRIVENMGMAWQRQSEKLMSSQAKFNCHLMMTVGADGRQREMLAMPVDRLPLWLATINPNKIKDPAIQAKVEAYQAESAIVLHDYWTKGFASRDEIHERTNGIARQMHGKVTRLERTVAELLRTVENLIVMHDPHRAVLDYVSVRQMLDEAKAITKGRNSLNRKFGHALKLRALQVEGPNPARKCAHSGVWLYQRDFAGVFMKDRGRALVGDHNARASGQGIIVFPDRRKNETQRPTA